jgi:tetratricopeptide (TPR) repeat protein
LPSSTRRAIRSRPPSAASGSRYLWVSGLSADALDAIATAVSLLPAGHELERARVLGAEGRLLMLLGRAAEARGRCEEALALARAAGDRRVETAILNSLGASVAMGGDSDRGIAYLREALRMAEAVGALEEIVRAYVNLSSALDEAGKVAEAADVATHGAAVAAREASARAPRSWSASRRGASSGSAGGTRPKP